MKNITVLDTNVILRYLLNDHPQHFLRAQAFMADVISGKITVYIPDSVLAECVYVLLKVYKVPKAKACEVLMGFFSNGVF
ncbi:MAG: PIN domain-containing protein [Methylovulum sp.]|uniref:PIN domain-containing protein n=1 Tax=Methylovulum sp. TaxID=1916980 RepID=UPI002611F61A|nr:PIN domain-containing protein [Methylovulum sp.]MDD2722991.1 PIN domain-containing protein [Methylovulum sp.]